MKHRGWIALSGCLWMVIGIFLLYKGLGFISYAVFTPDSLCHKFADVFGSPNQTGTVILAIGLFIGFLKGRFVFSKTVARVVRRIASLPLPIRFSQVYGPSYWILIGFMTGLGFLMKFLPIPLDVRGLVDVAVGSALVNGSMLYFRSARAFNPTYL